MARRIEPLVYIIVPSPALPIILIEARLGTITNHFSLACNGRIARPLTS